MAHAKVRALHPDFFSDEDVSDVSIPARLLFAGLWCFACDNGHLADKPKQIKRWIYATDDVNVTELLRELESVGDLLKREDGYLIVPALGKRQRIDFRYFKTCDRPGCERPKKADSTDSQPETLRAPAASTQSHAGGTRGPATDGVGVGEGEGDLAASGKSAKKAHQLPDAWSPSNAHQRLANERGVNITEEAAKFRDWCAGNGTAKKDWEATFRNWIRNARGGTPATVHQLRVDDQGRTVLPPLPPRSPWGN